MSDAKKVNLLIQQANTYKMLATSMQSDFYLERAKQIETLALFILFPYYKHQIENKNTNRDNNVIYLKEVA